MALLLQQFFYAIDTMEAWAALSKNPMARREGLKKLFESVSERTVEFRGPAR